MLVFSSFCFHLCSGRFVHLPLLTVINETNFTQPFKTGIPSKLSIFFFLNCCMFWNVPSSVVGHIPLSESEKLELSGKDSQRNFRFPWSLIANCCCCFRSSVTWAGGCLCVVPECSHCLWWGRLQAEDQRLKGIFVASNVAFPLVKE